MIFSINSLMVGALMLLFMLPLQSIAMRLYFAMMADRHKEAGLLLLILYGLPLLSAILMVRSIGRFRSLLGV